jgi:hypothetical protein
MIDDVQRDEDTPRGALIHPRRRRVDLGRATQHLIVIALLFTPLFNIGEVIGLIQGTIVSQVAVVSPIYLKALKDVLLILIALVASMAIIRSGRANALLPVALALLLYLAAAAVQATAVDPRLALAGLRWALPIVLSFLLVGFVDTPFVERIARVLAYLLILHFGTQVVELFVMSRWFGTSVLGLAARVPGIFFIPNSAGFFAVIALYFAIFHLRRSLLRTSVLGLAPVSIVLTQSGTGVVALVSMLALLWLGPRRSLLAIPIAPVAAVILFLYLPTLTGRGDQYVAISGLTRVQIFQDILAGAGWFPSAFGYATNTAVNMASSLSLAGAASFDALIADSTYTSIIGNLGLLGFAAFVLCATFWVVILLHTRRIELYVFTLLCSLYAATTILFESFPMSLLVSVLGARFLRIVYLPAIAGTMRRIDHRQPLAPDA